MMDCSTITPITAFQSTNLSSKIDTFTRLGERITRSLGAPMINVEIHSDQLYENISQACELFTKYAGQTEEYIVFDSDIYIDNVGVRLDQLFSVTPYFNKTNTVSKTVYVATSAIPGAYFANSNKLSGTYVNGIFVNQILTTTDYLSVINFNSAAAYTFAPSTADQTLRVNSFDYDIMDYRKVVDIFNFEEGTSDGINTLFTIEQTLA
jgi:hypothetical protein